MGQFPASKYAYLHYMGAYKDCHKAFFAALKLASNRNVGTLGIYYDDPKQVPDAKCRYAVGVLVPAGDPAMEARFKQAGYNMVDLPRSRCAVTTFPFTGMLSILIAVSRVYPALQKFCVSLGNKDAEPYMEVCPSGFAKEQIYYAVRSFRSP